MARFKQRHVLPGVAGSGNNEEPNWRDHPQEGQNLEAGLLLLLAVFRCGFNCGCFIFMYCVILLLRCCPGGMK
jgi:hypothetical protein